MPQDVARVRSLIHKLALDMTAQAPQAPPLDVQISQDGAVTFGFDVSNKGGKLTFRYQADAAAEVFLSLFDKVSNGFAPDVEDEANKAEAEKCATVALWILLGFMRPRFSEALSDLLVESTVHAGRVVMESIQLANDEQGTLKNDSLQEMLNLREEFARKQSEAVKKRIGARGRGAVRSLHISNVRRTVQSLGDHANQKGVAFCLGISERTLRDLVKDAGFPRWRDFQSSVISTTELKAEAKASD